MNVAQSRMFFNMIAIAIANAAVFIFMFLSIIVIKKFLPYFFEENMERIARFAVGLSWLAVTLLFIKFVKGGENESGDPMVIKTFSVGLREIISFRFAALLFFGVLSYATIIVIAESTVVMQNVLEMDAVYIDYVLDHVSYYGMVGVFFLCNYLVGLSKNSE